MSQPLSVSPSELVSAAMSVERMAATLADAIVTATSGIDNAQLPTHGWLAASATTAVVTLVRARAIALVEGLAAAGAALRSAAASYAAADAAAIRRYPGALSPDEGSRASPW